MTAGCRHVIQGTNYEIFFEIRKWRAKVPEWRNHIKKQQPGTLQAAPDRRSQGVIVHVLHLSAQKMNIENQAPVSSTFWVTQI